jgi:O-antigen/teichoic acid export membrane protein
MKLIVKTILLVLTMVCTYSISFAQAQQVEMADGMRSNGKIYIVVLVCLTILIGLFLYLLTLDRKISKLEK